jgi:hypothetical protein
MGRASQARGLLGYVGFRCPKFTGGTPIEVDMERLQRTMQWLAIRKEAGLKLDPETAEVEWCYAQTVDPYGVDPDLPEQCPRTGREYFARSPESDVWVNFRDLPKTIRDALWNIWHFPHDCRFLDNTPETEK